MPFPDLAWIALLGAVSGLMIGCIGIGGVILVPALVFVAGIVITIAIPAAMFAYILSGLVATYGFARNLPVAIAATVGNIIYGKLDLTLGAILAVTLSGGSWFGAKLAHAVPRNRLRRAGYHRSCHSRQCRLAPDRMIEAAPALPVLDSPSPHRQSSAVRYSLTLIGPALSTPSSGAGFVAIHTDVEYDDIAPGAVAVSAEHRRQSMVQKEQKC